MWMNLSSRVPACLTPLRGLSPPDPLQHCTSAWNLPWTISRSWTSCAQLRWQKAGSAPSLGAFHPLQPLPQIGGGEAGCCLCSGPASASGCGQLCVERHCSHPPAQQVHQSNPQPSQTLPAFWYCARTLARTGARCFKGPQAYLDSSV